MSDPTPEQIQSLKAEAQDAGDQDMVTICDLARGYTDPIKRRLEAAAETAAEGDRVADMRHGEIMWAEAARLRLQLRLLPQNSDLETAIRHAALERIAEVLDDARAQAVTLLESGDILGALEVKYICDEVTS